MLFNPLTASMVFHFAVGNNPRLRTSVFAYQDYSSRTAVWLQMDSKYGNQKNGTRDTWSNRRGGVQALHVICLLKVFQRANIQYFRLKKNRGSKIRDTRSQCISFVWTITRLKCNLFRVVFFHLKMSYGRYPLIVIFDQIKKQKKPGNIYIKKKSFWPTTVDHFAIFFNLISSWSQTAFRLLYSWYIE